MASSRFEDDDDLQNLSSPADAWLDATEDEIFLNADEFNNGTPDAVFIKDLFTLAPPSPGKKAAWQYNIFTKRMEFLRGEGIVLQSRIQANVGDVIVCQVHFADPTLNAHRKPRNCGEICHKNEKFVKSPFKIVALDNDAAVVEYDGSNDDHTFLVKVTGKLSELCLYVFCLGTEPPKKDAAKLWLLKIRGTLGRHRIDQEIAFQSMAFLRPPDRIQKRTLTNLEQDHQSSGTIPKTAKRRGKILTDVAPATTTAAKGASISGADHEEEEEADLDAVFVEKTMKIAEMEFRVMMEKKMEIACAMSVRMSTEEKKMQIAAMEKILAVLAKIMD